MICIFHDGTLRFYPRAATQISLSYMKILRQAVLVNPYIWIFIQTLTEQECSLVLGIFQLFILMMEIGIRRPNTNNLGWPKSNDFNPEDTFQSWVIFSYILIGKKTVLRWSEQQAIFFDKYTTLTTLTTLTICSVLGSVLGGFNSDYHNRSWLRRLFLSGILPKSGFVTSTITIMYGEATQYVRDIRVLFVISPTTHDIWWSQDKRSWTVL